MRKIKDKYGSVLVFALIILFIGIAAAIGIASSTMISQKNSINTASSVQSFQIADSGAEIVLNKIKNANNDDTLGELGLICNGGVISGNIGIGKDYKITAFRIDESSPINDCDSTTLFDIDRIKSIGSYKNTNRAVEVAVVEKGIPPNSDVMILMDYSSSMSAGDLNLQKDAVISFINNIFNQNGSDYKVGFIYFATDAAFSSQLTKLDGFSKPLMIEFIEDNPTIIDGLPRLTNMAEAIEKATEKLKDSDRHNTNPQIIILITDGAPNTGDGQLDPSYITDEEHRCTAPSSVSPAGSFWNVVAYNKTVEAAEIAKNEDIIFFSVGVAFQELESELCRTNATNLLKDISVDGKSLILTEMEQLEDALSNFHGK